MVNEEIKFGKSSARITIAGDNEKIVIRLHRNGINTWHNEINKHPKLFESVFPSWSDNIYLPLLASEEHKEIIFRSRIKRCLKILMDCAYACKKDEEDEDQKRMKEKINEESNSKNIDGYIKYLILRNEINE